MRYSHKKTIKKRESPSPFKTVMGNGIPQSDEGKNGDFTVRKVPYKGVFLYYKFNNIWYNVRLSIDRKSSEESEVQFDKAGDMRLPSSINLSMSQGRTLTTGNIKSKGTIEHSGQLFLLKGAAATDVTSFGQLWVRTSNKSLYFDDEDGNSHLISNSGGTILDSRSHNPGSVSSYTLTTSFATIDTTNAKVVFKAPRSGSVMIDVQITHYPGSSANNVYLGLSDNTTYNTVGAAYENLANHGITYNKLIRHRWVVGSLTPYTTYTWYIGAKTDVASGTLKWGGTSSLDNAPLTVITTAL